MERKARDNRIMKILVLKLVAFAMDYSKGK